MAKSTLTTINQLMSIASKAHYLNGGNTSKILAKDKKGIFTIEQVAETLDVNTDELKTLLQNNKIMVGDYVIDECWGDGEKLSTYALRTLTDKINKQQQTQNQEPQLWSLVLSWIIVSIGLIWLDWFDTVTTVFIILITFILCVAKPYVEKKL